MAKYSYNGTILPELPDTAYPNACITRAGTSDIYQLVVFGGDWDFAYNTTDGLGNADYIYATNLSGNQYTAHAEEWGLNEAAGTLSSATLYSESLTPIWSNFDIIAENGSVYLAASEPVPVGDESKKFDLKGFMTGLALGLAGKPLPLKEVE